MAGGDWIVVVGGPDETHHSHHEHEHGDEHAGRAPMGAVFDFSDYGRLLELVSGSVLACAVLGIVGG